MLAKARPLGQHAPNMKNLIGVIILAAACIGLAVALVTTKNRATDEKRKDTETILAHSNQWVETSLKLDEQRQVNVLLTNDLAAVKQLFTQTTNLLTKELETVSSNLAKTEATLKAEQEAVAQRDAKIAALESQNQELDQKAIDLSVALTNLTVQIAETQRKLDASEGDKAFLEKELKRLMAEKAELERQFNDLTVLRAQVAKLKEELSIARRLEWIRKGLFASTEVKGSQQLLQRGPTAPAPPEAKTNFYDLNVEVNADGSVRVIPPLTNAPATAPK